MSNQKIINDPVYGLISLKSNLVFEIIQHPYFQRLRNIHQLGLTHMVYPGATHTRFQHSIGAMHLMQNALEILSNKGVDISEEEKEATLAAILLHDIGHTAFSHALEYFFVENCSHEDFTNLIINDLNNKLGNKLHLTLQIIDNHYHKTFLHQLVSGQLDVDRLDYLNRDSFYTGVSEGVIGSERIIQMLNVKDNHLVAESKAIYSIEKFIISRRLMYWQVYLHKTVHAAEQMLVCTLNRAKYLYQQGKKIFMIPELAFFFDKNYQLEDFFDPKYLQAYIEIDDNIIWYCIKQWQNATDIVLSTLSYRLYNRNLFRIEIQEHKFDKEYLADKKSLVCQHFNISEKESEYFVVSGEMTNRAYNAKVESIYILDKKGEVHRLEELSDHLNHRTLSESVNKYFICYPKEIQ